MTQRNIKLVLQAIVAVAALIGVLQSHGSRNKELSRLNVNQKVLYGQIEAQRDTINALIASQRQIVETTPVSTPQADESGNDLTETLDYIGDVPKRVGREAERLLDKLNPF